MYQIKVITMMKNYDQSVEIDHNPIWCYISYYHYRILMASATDAAVQESFYSYGMITLIILKKELDDIRKIVRSLEVSGFLIKGPLAKQFKMKQKNEEMSFLVYY